MEYSRFYKSVITNVEYADNMACILHLNKKVSIKVHLCKILMSYFFICHHPYLA